MAKWARTIDIRDIMQSLRDGTMTHAEGLAKIVDQLEDLTPYENHEVDIDRLNLIEEIDILIDSNTDERDFNFALEMLYDFGDVQIAGRGFFDATKALWVKNF